MSDAPGRRRVVVVGSSHETRALAARLADEFDVTFVSDRRDVLAGARAEGVDARHDTLDRESELPSWDLAADAAVVATDRDKTNMLVAQQLKTLRGVRDIVVRVNDPDREGAFAGLDVATVCGSDTLTPQVSATLEEAI